MTDEEPEQSRREILRPRIDTREVLGVFLGIIVIYGPLIASVAGWIPLRIVLFGPLVGGMLIPVIIRPTDSRRSLSVYLGYIAAIGFPLLFGAWLGWGLTNSSREIADRILVGLTFAVLQSILLSIAAAIIAGVGALLGFHGMALLFPSRTTSAPPEWTNELSSHADQETDEDT